MADKQDLFWISRKSTYGCGTKSLKYGDRVEEMPDKLIAHFKKTGEIGAVEVATPDGVKTDAALEKVSVELKEANDKLSKCQSVIGSVIHALKQDSLKKQEKSVLIADLEALK